jgi:hypothetical protein
MKKTRVRPAEDRSETSTDFWEKLLKKEGLSMDAGRRRFRDASGREENRIVHVGDSNNVDAIYEMQVGQNGKVKPAGAGPDD